MSASVRRHLLVLLVLSLLAVAAALAVLPARWLMRAVPAQWPLALTDAHGTIWTGSATLALGPEGNRRALPHPVRWSSSVGSGPRLTVSHPWLDRPLVVSPTWSGAVVSAATLQLPAQVLSSLDPRLGAIGPEGELRLSWPALRTGVEPAAGTRLLSGEWRAASSALAPIRPLGHYTLTLSQGAPGEAGLKLATREGPLLLEGEGVVGGRGLRRFEGSARADPAAAPEVRAALHDLLGALGPRQNDVTLLRHQ